MTQRPKGALRFSFFPPLDSPSGPCSPDSGDEGYIFLNRVQQIRRRQALRRYFRCCARRLASSNRLVVLTGASAGPVGASGGGPVSVGAASGSCFEGIIVTGLCGRKRSG